MILKRLIPVFLLQFCIAQTNETFKFQNFDAKDFNCETISHQTWMSDGSFWAASDKGLLHHNGFTHEIINDEKRGNLNIASNNITDIYKVTDQELWISYLDTSLVSCFNPKKKSFKHYWVPELEDSTGQIGVVVRIKKSPEGTIWLCTWGSGLIRFNRQGENKQYLFFDDGTNKNIGHFVKDIAIHRDNKILVTFFNGRGNDNSFPLLFDSESEKTHSIDIRQLIRSSNPKMRSNIVTAARIVHWVYAEKEGRYWLGTYSGPLIMDLNEKYIKRIYEEEEDSLLLNQVNTLSYKNFQNQLWISTLNKGVLIIDMHKENAKYLFSDPLNSQTIISNRIGTISVDPSNNIWVSNGGNNLSIFSPFLDGFKTIYWNNFDLEYSNRSSQNIPVNQLYVKSSDSVYISSATGLIRFNTKYWKPEMEFKNADLHFKTNGKRVDRGITHFKIFGDSIMFHFNKAPFVADLNSDVKPLNISNRWSGDLGFRHEPKIKSFYYFKNNKQLGPLIQEVNTDFSTKNILRFSKNIELSERFSFLTSAGNWLLSENGGRFLLVNPVDSSFSLFSPSSDNSYFPDSTVTCALPLSNGEVLIGTQNGLYTFNEKNFSYKLLNEQCGLGQKELVNALVEDKNGLIWMAVRNEILCWNRANNISKRYGKSLGLNVSNFLPAVGQIDEDGSIYFVNMYGIVFFHPKNLEWQESSFQLFLEKVEVNGKPFKKLDKTLSWDQNKLKFDFYTNELFQIEPHHYEYRLLGRDRQWISNGNTNIVRLTGLNHGKYTLEIRAINVFGVKSNIVRISFTIKKPFWYTWWFYSLITLLGLALILFFIRARTLKLKKRSLILQDMVRKRTLELEKQKKEAENQKDNAEFQKKIVEEKQKEITDSINYAKRIQDAILPSEELIKEELQNAFVLYIPKDIVAGDFYWLERLNEDEVLYAAADCTGHGVPGALVSVVCNNALNRSVREFKETEPGKILDKSRELILSEFIAQNKDIKSEIKDGMDIALCKLNRKAKTLNYAGAHNPLWLLRNGELSEIKANKQPVGQFENSTLFDTHIIELEKNDLIYIFSDGYADQFGGAKGKKFKSSSLKKLLIEIHKLSMSEQQEALIRTFENWKGEYEQLDDVCVIGLKV